MKTAICVTERAAEHLKELLASHAENPEQCVRLVVRPDGETGILLDRARPGDNVIEVEGTPVLLMHSALAPLLEGATLDYADTCMGPQLTLGK